MVIWCIKSTSSGRSLEVGVKVWTELTRISERQVYILEKAPFEEAVQNGRVTVPPRVSQKVTGEVVSLLGGEVLSSSGWTGPHKGWGGECFFSSRLVLSWGSRRRRVWVRLRVIVVRERRRIAFPYLFLKYDDEPHEVLHLTPQA